MKISAKHYAQAVLEAVEQSDPKDQKKVLDNFVSVLAANNDVKLFDEISLEFEKLRLQHKDGQMAETFSKHELTRTESQMVVDELNKIVKKDIKLRKKVDENLIGGVVIKADDQVIDASVNNWLKQLKERIMN